MSDNVAVALPETEFVRPCNLCPHMKRITLPKILRCAGDAASTASRSRRRSPRGRGARSSACSRSGAEPAGERTLRRGARGRRASCSARASRALAVALGLAGRRVDLLTEAPLGHTGSSPWAQGGIAGAVGPGDSPMLHAQDTLAVAAGAGRRRGRGAPDERGAGAALAAWSRSGRASTATPRAASTSAARPRTRGAAMLHARDATGAELVRALVGALSPARSGRRSSRGRSRTRARHATADASWEPLARHADGAPGAAPRARRWCSPPAVSATSSRGPRTRVKRAATASRSPGAPALGSSISSSCSSTRRRSTSAPTRCRFSPRRCAATVRSWSTSGAAASSRTCGPTPSSLPRDVVARALWAALGAGRRALLDARGAVGEALPGALPDGFRSLPAPRARPAARADPRRPRGALPHGRYRRGRRRAHEPSRSLGRGRGGLHGRPRRQPAGEQLAPRGARVRRARSPRRCAPRCRSCPLPGRPATPLGS